MGADQHHSWSEIAAGAIDWWRDAGVDVLVDDAPRDWLAKAKPAGPERALPSPPAVPDTLAAFAVWRIGAEAPEAGWGAPLRAAEGDPAAGLMVIVDCPDDEGLIGGAAGRLFDRMLAAIGRDRASVYLAAFAVSRPIGGRIPAETEPALADLLRRHVGLAGPNRVLVLGQAASRALAATDAVPSRGTLHRINLKSATVELVVGLHPRFLLDGPHRKAEAWKDLQLLIGEQA